jgi:hypothetical protein
MITISYLKTCILDKNSESIEGITPLHIAGKTNAVNAAVYLCIIVIHWLYENKDI